MTKVKIFEIFAVFKPSGITSHDVVDKVRAFTGERRVGHGGTLDPLAEGVLVIAVGRKNTKQLDKYVKGDKEYVSTLKLGEVSETDDSEGPIHTYKNSSGKKLSSNEVQPQLASEKAIIIPSRHDIEKCLTHFTGKIMQTPPIYSAIKVGGKPAYKYARQARKQGGTLYQGGTLKPRAVEIRKIEIISYEYPALELKIECGSGVYIRSLARDLGNELKTGAYLTKLVRTRVGEFKIDDCLKIEELKID
jgi:tRNA pseudouridine55 synthase